MKVRLSTETINQGRDNQLSAIYMTAQLLTLLLLLAQIYFTVLKKGIGPSLTHNFTLKILKEAIQFQATKFKIFQMLD